MKRLKRIYLASPYSHQSKVVMSNREYEINYILGKLYWKYHVAIIPPILISAKIKEIIGNEIGDSFKEWSEVDYAYILGCDAVWVAKMDCWEDSIGVTAEIKFAKQNNIPVKYIDTQTLKLSSRPKKSKQEKADAE